MAAARAAQYSPHALASASIRATMSLTSCSSSRPLPAITGAPRSLRARRYSADTTRRAIPYSHATLQFCAKPIENVEIERVLT